MVSDCHKGRACHGGKTHPGGTGRTCWGQSLDNTESSLYTLVKSSSLCPNAGRVKFPRCRRRKGLTTACKRLSGCVGFGWLLTSERTSVKSGIAKEPGDTATGCAGNLQGPLTWLRPHQLPQERKCLGCPGPVTGSLRQSPLSPHRGSPGLRSKVRSAPRPVQSSLKLASMSFIPGALALGQR